MSADAEEVAEEYRSSLRDLVNNSKPLITMLTMLAEENRAHASVIVKVIEEHIQEVSGMLYYLQGVYRPCPCFVEAVEEEYGGKYTWRKDAYIPRPPLFAIFSLHRSLLLFFFPPSSIFLPSFR